MFVLLVLCVSAAISRLALESFFIYSKQKLTQNIFHQIYVNLLSNCSLLHDITNALQGLAVEKPGGRLSYSSNLSWKIFSFTTYLYWIFSLSLNLEISLPS